jgi:hypothetical protein
MYRAQPYWGENIHMEKSESMRPELPPIGGRGYLIYFGYHNSFTTPIVSNQQPVKLCRCAWFSKVSGNSAIINIFFIPFRGSREIRPAIESGVAR